jgi:hypothetical protein
VENRLTSVTPEDDEVRHYCRNPRCRSKLPAAVSNPREAFCTRGCHNNFYRRCCLICERPIEQPKRGKRKICSKAKCRAAYRNNSWLGRYHTSSAAKLISKEADFIGRKEPLQPERPWRVAAGSALNPSALHCATIGGDEKVEAINRTNFKHWRGANSKSEQKTLIESRHPPVNLLGGYTHPGAPVVDLARSKPATSDAPQAEALFTDDRLDIPEFLRRTALPSEALAAQNRRATRAQPRRRKSLARGRS